MLEIYDLYMYSVSFDSLMNLQSEIRNFYQLSKLKGEREGIEFGESFLPCDTKYYTKPNYTIKEFAEKLPVHKTNLRMLGLKDFLSNVEGIDLFKDIEMLSIKSDSYSFKEIAKEVGKDRAFFKVDLSWYPKLRVADLMRLENIINLEKAHIETLFLTKIPFKQLEKTEFPSSVKHLFLRDIKLKDLAFIKAFKEIEFLELTEVSIMDFSYLKELKNLKELNMLNCKDINLDTLKSNSLKKLDFYDRRAKPIPSIGFIKNLPNLETILINRKIEDKDLTPLIEHPSIKEIAGGQTDGYNYTIEQVFEIKEKGSLKKTKAHTKDTNNKMNYKLPYFEQEINSNALDSYYDTVTEKNGQEINIDLNFEANKLEASEFDKIKMFLDNLEAQDTKNKAYINTDYTNEDSTGSVQEFLEFHLEELADELGGISEKELLNKVKLQRVGIYPDSTDAFAICDYGIGTDVSYYIIVLYLNEKGNLKDMSWES